MYFSHAMSHSASLFVRFMARPPAAPDWRQVSENFPITSDDSLANLHDLVHPNLPFIPHDWQLRATLATLSRQNVLCIAPTGSGKTSLIFLPILAVQNSISIVITPTNSLEFDMVSILDRVESEPVANVQPGKVENMVKINAQCKAVSLHCIEDRIELFSSCATWLAICGVAVWLPESGRRVGSSHLGH
jgi:hypothetical protein